MNENTSNQLVIQKAQSGEWKVVTTCEPPIAVYSLCGQDPTDASTNYPIVHSVYRTDSWETYVVCDIFNQIWKLQVEESCIHYSLICSNPTWKIETICLWNSLLIVSCRDGTISFFRDSRMQKEYHLPCDHIGVSVLCNADHSLVIDNMGDIYNFTEDWKKIGHLGPGTSQHKLIDDQLVYLKERSLYYTLQQGD